MYFYLILQWSGIKFCKISHFWTSIKLKIIDRIDNFWKFDKKQKAIPGNDVSCGMKVVIHVKYKLWVVKIGKNGRKRLKNCLFARYCTLNMPSSIENTIFL